MSRIFIHPILYLLLILPSLHIAAQPENSITVPFTLLGNMLVIEAVVNDQQGLFIVDTGAPGLMLNSARVESMHIPWAGYEVIDFNGQRSMVKHLVIRDFHIGGMAIDERYAMTLDMKALEKAKGARILGIIGYEILKKVDLIIDFLKLEIRMTPSSRKNKAFASIPKEHLTESYRIKMSGHVPYVEARLGGKKFKMGIDSGAEINLVHDRSMKRLMSRFVSGERLRIMGVSKGRRTAESGVVNGLSIAGRQLGPTPVTLASMDPLNSNLTTNLDGILGIPFLKSGKVGLSYRSRKLCFWNTAQEDLHFVEKTPTEKPALLADGLE